MIRDLIACTYDIFSMHLGNGVEGNFLSNCLFMDETKFLNETIKASIIFFFSQN